jgi:AcrR family transcriptional regulator
MAKLDKTEPLELKEACVRAAREVIAEHGIEHLSLREVARRLGVSHQAPYRHYPSRDHLLAEVMRRCFESFAQNLDARERSEDPTVELNALGRRYLAYAASNPLEYRLMFGTAWPEPAAHPDLVKDAVHAFDVLRTVLKRIFGEKASAKQQVDMHAMFIWSSMHGLATITESNVMSCLNLTAKAAAQAPTHVMHMVELALAAAARRE